MLQWKADKMYKNNVKITTFEHFFQEIARYPADRETELLGC